MWSGAESSLEKPNWFRDWQLGAAFMVAPVVWTSLYLIDTPPLKLEWVSAAPLLFLMLILVRPVLEEIVFRGLLQGWSIKQSWGRESIVGITYANITISIVFAALHLMSLTPFMAALVFIPSLVFGYFRDRYNGWLIPGILLHCFYNAGYFLLYRP